MAITGILQSLITEFSKKHGLSVLAAYFYLSLIVGIVYQSFIQFLPEGIQTDVKIFVLGAAGSASLFYGFVIKKLKKD